MLLAKLWLSVMDFIHALFFIFVFFPNTCHMVKLIFSHVIIITCLPQTNDSLVQPLLRMRDSYVSVMEGERVLRHAHKYPELVLLLQTRGQHQRALQLLLRHAKKPESPLFGHHHTVSYLQHLGKACLCL